MEEYEYYESKGLRAVCIAIIMVIMVLLGILFVGCKTVKKSVNEKTDTKDSVRIEYREKVVKVPVTVYVEVPVEQKETMTKDSTSHLETSFAISNASMVWIDGVPFLRHDLKNKAQKIEKTDTANVVEKEKVIWKTRRVTYTKSEIREKVLPWYKTCLMWIGFISIIVILIWLVFKLLRR